MNISKIKRKLQYRRDEILEIAEKIDKRLGHRGDPLHPNSAERALQMENVDALIKIDQEIGYELKLINDALERIESGRFGFCTVCGSPIDSRRINLIPYIDTCFSCA